MGAPEMEGFEVRNEDVQGFIRKHGPASYSKPHGPEKMILYYPAPLSEAEDEEVEPFEDHAGEKTVATKDRIIQGSRAGSRLKVEPRVVGPSAAQVDASQQNLNEAVKDAEVLSADAADEELETEEEEQEEIEALSELTVAELQDLAAEKDISGRSSMNKAELIEALESQE